MNEYLVDISERTSIFHVMGEKCLIKATFRDMTDYENRKQYYIIT